MTYVFDTSALIPIFTHYYRDRFPTLWAAFDEMVDDKSIIMPEECFHEIGEQNGELHSWAKNHKGNFVKPDIQEALVVRDIFAVPHFRQVVDQKKILKGGFVADPFIIAKAKILSGTVVTMEKLKPKAAKIPNICQHFGVACFTLEQFMATEDWTF